MTSVNVADVIKVHDTVTQIYHDAMQQVIEKIYKEHDKDEVQGQLSKKEALGFFFDVFGVINQDRELAIAHFAADLANMDKEGEITKQDMEDFVVNLYTGQYDQLSYEAYNEQGKI